MGTEHKEPAETQPINEEAKGQEARFVDSLKAVGMIVGPMVVIAIILKLIGC